jgi:aspartyl-tRNA(Asn)/glutamyl-tRNA(Gln) amidotransferase subunit B
MNTYRPLVGLEIHVELKTASKMFCQCSADWFGMAPNTNVCPVCLGLPGALPVPNKQAIDWIIKIGKALHCTIAKVSKFDRKHYFYPDLPKGYQISQYDQPFCEHGYVELRVKEGDEPKRFRITRVHMEEDTGKLTHHQSQSLVDFNRSGAPLVEIVTEADFDSSDDVKRFLEELHTIIRYLDVSDANMEQGSMRLEPNISVRKPGEEGFPPYKVEVKNINSFSFVKKAIDFEVERQTEILKKGETPRQETRGYNEAKGETVSQRVKEEAADYRYFPEPDIPPFLLDPSCIDSIEVLELPEEKLNRFMSEYQLKRDDAFLLTRDLSLALYFESVCESVAPEVSAQQVANYINNKKIPTTIDVADFVKKVKELSAPKKTDTAALQAAITEVMNANEKAVADFRAGKEASLMFLLGQVMRHMKGQADAQTVRQSLLTALNVNV